MTAQRIFQIAQKPLGIAMCRGKVTRRAVLPFVGSEEIDATLQFLHRSCWAHKFQEHALCSICTSLRKQTPLSAGVLESLYHCITGRKESISSAAMESCCTAILATISENSAYYNFAKKTLDHLVLTTPILSTTIESSALSVYGGDVVGLIEFVKMIRQVGHKPSITLYSSVLKTVMESSRSEMMGGQLNEAVSELVASTSNDWGKEKAQAAVFSAALQVARNKGQIDTIWKDFVTSGNQPDEKHSLLLVDACLRLQAQARDDLASVRERLTMAETMVNKRESAGFAVSTLSEKIVSCGFPVTIEMFEDVFHACATSHQLELVITSLRCMLDYGIAPSRKGYSSLMRILCNPFIIRNVQQKLSLIYHVMGGTVALYGDKPPVWIYVETAKPLVQVIGMQGYKIMFDLSVASLDAKTHDFNLQQLWNQRAYHSIVKVASAVKNKELAFPILDEIQAMGHIPDQWTLMSLFNFVRSEEDLHFLNHLLFLIEHLSKNQVQPLEKRLARALQRVLSQSLQDGHIEAPNRMVNVAAHGIMQLLSCSSHEHCVSLLLRHCIEERKIQIDEDCSSSELVQVSL